MEVINAMCLWQRDTCFAKRIDSGEQMAIFGDGEQTRDFVNVKDVAKADYLTGTTEKGTGVYNLSSGGRQYFDKRTC